MHCNIFNHCQFLLGLQFNGGIRPDTQSCKNTDSSDIKIQYGHVLCYSIVRDLRVFNLREEALDNIDLFRLDIASSLKLRAKI
jgi:hypothetical protein